MDFIENNAGGESESQAVSDYETLVSLNQDYLTAYGNSDSPGFEGILANDFRETTSSGEILEKAEFLNKISEQPKPPTPMLLEAGELEIRIFGDTAIVHAIPSIAVRDGFISVRGRYTDVYSRIDGQWRCVAAHLGADMNE